MIEVGGIDWRFADPFSDAVIGFNARRLFDSPLSRKLIAQLAASQGLNEANTQKICDRVSGLDHVAVSVRGDRTVLILTGPVTESTLPLSDARWRSVRLPGSAMLIGDAESVDQAVQRIATRATPADLTRFAAELQDKSDFWAVGSSGLPATQAMTAGVKRFSLGISIRNGLTSDLALEFYEIPSANTVRTWETTPGTAAIEGNVVYIKTSMEADEAQRKFASIVTSPPVQRLAALLKAAQCLPVRDTPVRKTRAVIYGLDDGPKEVVQ